VTKRVALATRDELADLVVEAGALTRRVESLEQRVKEAEERVSLLELRKSMEAGDLGLLFEQVDTRPPKRPFLSRRKELALVGVVSFLIFLPLSLIAVGALDRRIRSLDDVEQLGFVAFGRLPARKRRESRSSVTPRREIA
jgi:hypothetical protein